VATLLAVDPSIEVTVAVQVGCPCTGVIAAKRTL
jgi:hypothetical protein